MEPRPLNTKIVYVNHLPEYCPVMKKSDPSIILKDFAERLNFKIAPHIEFQIITVIGKGQENQIRTMKYQT